MDLQEGRIFKIVKKVTSDHTARSAGSGGLEVLGTPFLAAFFEAAAYEGVETAMDSGKTTVGVKLDLDHTKATAVGDTVTVTAELVKVDGKKLDFSITGEDSEGIIGKCFHRRVVIDIKKFEENIKRSNK